MATMGLDRGSNFQILSGVWIGGEGKLRSFRDTMIWVSVPHMVT